MLAHVPKCDIKVAKLLQQVAAPQHWRVQMLRFVWNVLHVLQGYGDDQAVGGGMQGGDQFTRQGTDRQCQA